MALEDVDKKSKNRTSKWKNLLKSRKYEKQKCRIDEKFSEALLQLLVLFQLNILMRQSRLSSLD